jgi:hypothetical protein
MEFMLLPATFRFFLKVRAKYSPQKHGLQDFFGIRLSIFVEDESNFTTLMGLLMTLLGGETHISGGAACFHIGEKHGFQGITQCHERRYFEEG